MTPLFNEKPKKIVVRHVLYDCSTRVARLFVTCRTIVCHVSDDGLLAVKLKKRLAHAAQSVSVTNDRRDCVTLCDS